MKVALLMQYRSIVREIEEKETELKRRLSRGVVRGSDKDFPYTVHTISIEGVNEECSGLLESLRKLKEMRNEIERFIAKIPDSITRRVFEYRYIKPYGGGVKPMSWRAVARRVGHYDEQFPRKIHKKYMEKAVT